jgi:hypothetical protein
MSDAMHQTSRPMLHGLRPRNAHDELVSDNSRASTSNVLIIDEHPCRVSQRLRLRWFCRSSKSRWPSESRLRPAHPQTHTTS